MTDRDYDKLVWRNRGLIPLRQVWVPEVIDEDAE